MDPRELFYLILPKESDDILKIVINDLNKQPFNHVESDFEKFIIEEIFKNPYPTLQILEPFVKQYDYLQECILAVMKLFLSEKLKNETKFFNFLVNCPLNKQNAIPLNEDIISLLSSANPELSGKLFLSLFARNDFYHIKSVFNNIYKRSKGITNKRILFKALSDNEHILAYALNQVNFEIQNDIIRNNLIVMKILKELQSTNQCIDDVGNLNKFLEQFVLINATDFHKVIFKDFCRIKMLIEFLKKYSTSIIPIEKVLRKNGILKVLYDHKNIILIDYEETRQIVEKNYDFITQIVNDKKIFPINNDLQVLTYFFVLVTIYDIIVMNIQTDHGSQTYINEKILKLKMIIRQIREINILCDLIEDIFKLMFIRYEHLHPPGNNCYTYKKSQTSTDESLNNRNQYANSMQKQGFICRMNALNAILTFLKTLITIKLHSDEYKNGDKLTQQRFVTIIECINDGLQKLAVLKNLQNNENDKININSDDLLSIVVPHLDIGEKASSEDDNRDRSNYASLSRRKAKTKKRHSVSHVDKKRLLTDKKPNNEKIEFPCIDDRSIILKILYQPKDLALMALTMQNFDDVKNIVQAFHLQNSDLEQQLIFVENQQQVKQKLNNIYEKYEGQEMASEKVYSTIEKIKKVAAKGFEASKIISIVENFSITNKTQQTEDIRNIIKKYSTNYEFLVQYEGNSKRVITVLDLILNSSFNYEITSSICNSIENPNKQLITERPTNQSKSKLGSWPFLENLIECLRLLKNDDSNKANLGIQEMLTDNFYSLRPLVLRTELDKEKNFQNIFYKSNSQTNDIEELKNVYKEFDEIKSKSSYFNRFLHYIINLSKLLLIRDRNINLNTTEILKFDPKIVIGDLIFNDDMTPLEIEGNVVALNLNLVHLIALNLCPEFAQKTTLPTSSQYKISKEKYKSIFNYITSQNMLLGYLLQKIYYIDNDFPKTEINEEFLTRMLEFPEVRQLSEMYGGNQLKATLLSDYCDNKRIIDFNDINSVYCILSSFIEMAVDRQYLEAKRNEIIIKMLNISGKYDLLEKISDLSLRAVLLNKNYNRINNFTLVNRLIKSVLQHKDFNKIPKNLQSNLEKTLKDIKVYAEVSIVLEHSSWKESYDFSIRSPSIILENLLDRNKYQLCLEWCRTVNLSTNYSHSIKIFLNIFLKTLLEVHSDSIDLNLMQIFETFPPTEICQFYDIHKEKFRCLQLLNYILEYLEKYQPKMIYKNFKLSLNIFQHLSVDERNENWNFLSKPLLIIEQLVMNCKFKTLSTILNAIKPNFEKNANYKNCEYCYDKRGNIYDIHSRHPNKFVLGDEHSSAFILLNFNLYQKDHIVQLECIDLILRIYATKALDYQINEIYSSSERISQSNDLSSLDSLCGTFVMPKQAPTKEQWIKDEDAVHCMCCKRAVFTMLIRRHHCRRCGRVICFACSTNRLKITNLYDDVPVRACNDCINQTKQIEEINTNLPFVENKSVNEINRKIDDNRWQLSGNITHDKLLREEFCYEHAPSVGLCLSILSYHSNNPWCVNLLLFHCRKLEKLLVPNPEVDYALVARMMNCLAVAAKVRNGPPECDQIRDHSEMITSVVQSGCESLISSEPLNNRKFADSLVYVEKWSLALNIFLKCGFPTAGVMAAHGLSCLRAGCFETAREKFNHCLTKVSTEKDNMTIWKIVTNENDLDMNKEINIPVIKRPNRGPPLLDEIVKIIESTNFKTPKPETLARAIVIRSSNSSLASSLLKRKDNIPMHEPALNILNSLANLKEITKGNYIDKNVLHSLGNRKHIIRQSRAFEESLHYILTYGSHSDVINFLMRRQEYSYVLRYFILQNLDAEIFVQNIFLKFLKTGNVNELIDKMLQIDDRLLIWKDTIIYTCRYLETKNLFNSLYQMQLLLKDPVRASMTCVKFYSMNCATFQELEMNSFHLHNAQKHLQTELELCQWENINIKQKRGQEQLSFLMQMDAKSLNAHINSILRQLEVTKFLAKREKDCGVLNILRQIRDDCSTIPTLFDSVQEKILICILILLSGKNIEEGFGLAYRIIEDYKVPSIKVYSGTAKYLSRNNRLEHVEKLINSILSSNGKNRRDIDEILSVAIYSAINVQETEVKMICDNLIKKIQSIETQISCHIFIGQLKAAYLLAIHHNRLNDVRKILRHAEATNQLHIKKLCEKKLNIN